MPYEDPQNYINLASCLVTSYSYLDKIRCAAAELTLSGDKIHAVDQNDFLRQDLKCVRLDRVFVKYKKLKWLSAMKC